MDTCECFFYAVAKIKTSSLMRREKRRQLPLKASKKCVVMNFWASHLHMCMCGTPNKQRQQKVQLYLHVQCDDRW
jgi:hypothetical protein